MKIKNKKVLVTGADGFIGSHLVEELLSEGVSVRAFCFYNSFNSCGWLDTFSKSKISQIDIFTGDIRDHNGVYEALKGMDMVFHLAALVGIPYSYHSPDNYIDTNVKGTLNILQASRKHSLERVVITSTSEVYGTALYVPIDEKHPLQGQSPYSASKIAADKIAQSFLCSFNSPISIVRPFNTYGPRQSARAIIPTIITQLLAGTDKLKLGNLYPTRDMVFVKDTARAFIEIAKSDKAIGEETNIATQTEVSIEEIAKKLIKMISPNAKIATDPARIRPEKSEVKRLMGSNKKIAQLTRWKAQYSLDKGLKETVDWFKSNKNKIIQIYKTDQYNV